ncbi:glucose-1-phosphate cytidylyltransferase [Selenomonas sp. TAMA-11512]|uniref:glucose-1-phosphate cytidylyltransferase n=1 Tax=Selenomonas sp. TAMA-11512 TaxID=3095337 RepID=UPI00308694B3|nr:glucose-1-phosphate cytidylyltransferase [Selenomonas sp. TAMA-11512]
MKVVILAGGRGTRISEETTRIPKPMVSIGDMPILWHIMKIYSHYGFYEFIICCGYKSYVIKDFFKNYFIHQSDVTFDYTEKNGRIIHATEAEPWKVTLAETGLDNMTGSRIRQIQRYIPEGESFLLTYGDGVADIDLNALLACHEQSGAIVTVTAVQPPPKFGVLDIDSSRMVRRFMEKPKEDTGWINGGFMAMDYDVFEYLDDDPLLTFEQAPLEELAADGELSAYKHTGFWQPMDTLRDRMKLEKLWQEGAAPWKVWKN